MLHRKTTTASRLALLLGVSAAAFAAEFPALAQDATWQGATGAFSVGSNWSGNSVPTGTATFTATGATSVTAGVQTIGGFTFAPGASAYTFVVVGGLNFLGAGIVNNSGLAQTLNTLGTLVFRATSTAGNATITNNGALYFRNTSTADNATITNYGSQYFYETSTAGNATITNNRTQYFTFSSTAGNATITNNSALVFVENSTAGGATITNNAVLRFLGTSTAGNARLITTEAGSTTFAGAGPLGDGRVSAGSIEGAGSYNLGSVQLTVGGNGRSTEVSGIISGAGGSLTKTGAGTLTLSGANSYTGATTVNAGTLIVNGSIAASSSATVAAGATVGGSGTLPTTVINGGTLSPGNSPGTLTVNGNLTLNPGSSYIAEIQGAVADRVNVTGTAALAGTLRIVPLGGAYTFNSAYTLLSAVSGLGGTTFGTIDPTGAFGDGVATTVSYTANDVLLTLVPKLLTPQGSTSPGEPGLGMTSPRNAHALAAAIDAAVAIGADPSSLFGIYNLPAASIPAAVNQLSGEVHTAAPAMANVASDQFLRTMLDPTAAGRLGAGTTGPGAAAFSGLVRKGADQLAVPARLDQPFYSVWGSAYGSFGRTDGDAGIGSARRSIDDAHLASGVDLRLLPGTVAGLAVSGGKARASLPGLLGKIDADVFQAGLYGVTQLGAVRLGGALSYARLENDVSRGIPALGSALSSSYATTAWSGRLQASASLLEWNGLSLSPLAALQATRARSPAVIEANWAGASAGALALAKSNDVTSRSEFGLQIDADTVLGGIPVTGYARAAWAHYFQRDADLTASLAGLPGAAFTATGAEVDHDSALLSAGVTAKLSETISLGFNLDSELSATSSRIGGSAQLRISF